MAFDINELTLGQINEVAALAHQRKRVTKADTPLPFKIGDAILIRTVTMIDVGRVTAIGRDFIVLTDGGWVADTGRFSEMLATGKLNEFEKVPDWFMVGRGAIVEVYPWRHALPTVTK